MKTARIILSLSYAAVLTASLWLAYQVRFNFAVPSETENTFLLVFAWVIGFKLICLWLWRQFDAFLGYFSLSDFSRLSWVVLISNSVIFCVSSQLGANYAPPRGVVLA